MRGGKGKSIMDTFVRGVMVLVLIIIAGIISGIAILPAVAVAAVVDMRGLWIVSILGIVVGIYFLGYVFGRFKVSRKW